MRKEFEDEIEFFLVLKMMLYITQKQKKKQKYKLSKKHFF